MLPSLVLALAVQIPAPAAHPDGADAYLDGAAGEVVTRARAYRARVDRSIERYQAVSTERISLGVSALRRERLFFRRETAARLDWRRDGVTRIEVLGARQVLPAVLPGVRVADDADAVRHHAFDPSGDRLMLGLSDSSFVHHPLSPGSEAHYRFRSGDTTVIRLPDARTVRLYAIEVLPAVQDVHHLVGTIWIDADSYAMVRAVFRLAEAFDLERDGDEGDIDDVPGVLKPIRVEVKYFTIEYGLWELRWWLPRLIAFEAVGTVGSFLGAPVRYERTYRDYRVEGDTAAPLVARADVPEPDPDSALAACFARGHCKCDDDRCSNVAIVLPDDTLSLLSTPYLPPSIYEQDETLMTATELRELSDRLEHAIPEPPWRVGPPEVAWGLGGSGLVRYNRVEGLSVGARAAADFGRLRADGTARVGLAGADPEVELGAVRDRGFTSLRLAGYHRLAAMNPWTRPLGIGNSVGSLVWGEDDGEYFRASGVELTGRPARTGGGTAVEWRVHFERQRAVAAGTDFSLRHLARESHTFRPTLRAEAADALGGGLVVRHSRGLDPAGFRWGAEVEVAGATGTFDYGRAAAVLRAGTPLPGPWIGSIEVAGGSSVGTVPVQSRWFLGGATTVRGYHGAAAHGEAFWRARAEVGTSFPAARLALFSDAGWAGPRDARRLAPALASAGVGASFLDGLVRIDVARAFEGATGWRLHLYVDGVL